MSKPASKTVIGLFVLCAIALAVLAILALGSGKFFKKTVKAVCYFEGSVGGLNVGAPVVIRGVKVGTVKDIVLNVDPKKLSVLIPVFIEMEQQIQDKKDLSLSERRERWKRWVDAGLRARLEMQSIVTGQLQVGLDLYPDKPAKFVGDDPEYLEIPTIPTAFQELAKKVEKIPIEEIFQKILSAVEGIERVVNSPEIMATVRSVSQASDEAKNLIRDVNRQVMPLGTSIQEALKDYGRVAQNVNAQIDPVVSNLNETVKEVRKLVQNVDAKVDPMASNLNETVKEVKKLVQNVDAQIDPMVSNLSDTVREMRKLVQNADTQIARMGPDLREAVGDIRKLIQDTNGHVGTIASSVKEAVEEYGKIAKNVDSRIPAIASGLEKNLDELQRTLTQAQTSLAVIADSFNENATLYIQLSDTLKELTVGARSIRLLADYLKRHPESVLWGKGKSGGK